MRIVAGMLSITVYMEHNPLALSQPDFASISLVLLNQLHGLRYRYTCSVHLGGLRAVTASHSTVVASILITHGIELRNSTAVQIPSLNRVKPRMLLQQHCCQHVCLTASRPRRTNQREGNSTLFRDSD